MTARVIHGDCLDVMRETRANTFHAVVTDPPYGLSFMGRDWDHGVPGEPFWREALRIARPGAPLLAFGGSRTFHRLACAIEDAGWEIRDTLCWLYGSGFPKTSMTEDGRSQALKPAWEPIVLARKPLDGTVAQNAERWGVGGLWVDGCRIEGVNPQVTQGINSNPSSFNVARERQLSGDPHEGRWPANVILDEQAAAMLDAEAGERRSAGDYPSRLGGEGMFGIRAQGQLYADAGGPSRFFYTAKASRSERGEFNVHPTVKPLALMRWLVRLVKPPRGGVILDPFAGSGTTGIACQAEGVDCVLVEKEAEHVDIIRRRLGQPVDESPEADEPLRPKFADLPLFAGVTA